MPGVITDFENYLPNYFKTEATMYSTLFTKPNVKYRYFLGITIE